MSKVIQFPKKDSDALSSLESLLENAFSNVAPEIRDSYKKEFSSTLKKHSINSDSVSLSFPDTITKDQIKALRRAFATRDNAFKELLKDLLIAKLEICKLRYKNS